MDFSKGQSAIEYLTTYGWMLLVVAIIGGLLFALASDQELESETVQGLEDKDLVVEDFATSDQEGIQFNLRSRAPREMGDVELCLSNKELGVEKICQTTESTDIEELEETVINFEGFEETNRTYEYDAYLEWNPTGLDTKKKDKGTVEISYAPAKDEESKSTDPELKTVDAVKSSAEFVVQANVPGILEDSTTKKLLDERLPRPLVPQYNFNTDDTELGDSYEEARTSAEFYIQDTISQKLGITPSFEFGDLGMVTLYSDKFKFGQKFADPNDPDSNPLLTGKMGAVMKLHLSEGEIGGYIQDINDADNNIQYTYTKNTLEGFTRWEIDGGDNQKALSLVLLDTNNDTSNLYGFGTTDRVSEMIDTVEGEKYDSSNTILVAEQDNYESQIGVKGLRINESLIDTSPIEELANLSNTSMSYQDAKDLGFDTIDFAYSTNQNDKIAIESNLRIATGPSASEMVNLTKTGIMLQNSKFEQNGYNSLEWLETDLKLNDEDQVTFNIKIDETVHRYQQIINNTATIANKTTG